MTGKRAYNSFRQVLPVLHCQISCLSHAVFRSLHLETDVVLRTTIMPCLLYQSNTVPKSLDQLLWW